MGKNYCYSAREIAQLDEQSFDTWLEFLYKNPQKFKNLVDHQGHSNSHWLHECRCQVSRRSIRRGYEDRILNALKLNNPDDPVRLLSLGSGGLFQDLMILLKLFYRGYPHIELDCIETQDNEGQQIILQAIIERLNQKGASIKVNHFKSIHDRALEVPAYDVVYAIDFDNINNDDYSNRRFDTPFYFKMEGEGTHSVFTLMLAAYAKLKQNASALFLLTFGANSLAYQGEKTFVHYGEEDRQFEKRMEAHAYHDYYYINSNILSLLFYLPFLKKKKKPVLINEAILYPSTLEAVLQILNQHDISYFIASEEKIGQKLDEECASVLIIDNTKIEGQDAYIHPLFEHGHAQVSRVARSDGRVDVFFAFNDIKARQISQKIASLSLETYLERVQLGVKNYLDWCLFNTGGTRGISRFSHWYHGGSGLKRAKEIQKLTELFDQASPEEFEELKSMVKEKLKGSSNARHSLSRFICSALTEDLEVESLPDAAYKRIRSMAG